VTCESQGGSGDRRSRSAWPGWRIPIQLSSVWGLMFALAARLADRASLASRLQGMRAEVREWAKAQGIDVKDRGRVPAELVVKFKAATTR